jgi:hypothetical protein
MRYKYTKKIRKQSRRGWPQRAMAVFLLSIVFAGIISFVLKPQGAQAAIAVVNKSTATGASTSVVVTKPSGIATSNVMLAQITFTNTRSTVTVTPPSGWTIIGSLFSSGSVYYQVMYYKVATASEPTSYTWTLSRSSTYSAGIAAFSGTSKTAPIDSSASQTDSSSTTLSAPSVNINNNNDMLVSFWGYGRQINASSYSSGLTDLMDASTTNIGISSADEIITNTGASGTTSSTVTTATTARASTIALKPSSAAAGVVFVASDTPVFSTSTGSLTAAAPSGWQAGDLLITNVSMDDSTATFTPPSGWTQINSTNSGGGYQESDFYHFAVAGDPSSYTWTFSPNTTGAIVSIVDFSGVDPSNPIDVDAEAQDATGTSHNAPSVTTNYTADMLFDVWTYERGNTATSHTSSLNQVWSVRNASGIGNVGLFSGYETLGNPGSTGTRNTVIGSTAGALMHTITLKPYIPTPTLTNPQDGATDTILNPVFNLANVSLTGSPLQYVIYLCSNSTCSSVISTFDQTVSQTGWSGQDADSGTAYVGGTSLDNSTVATYTAQTALSAGTQYWWQARSYDTSAGTFSLRSGIFSFTTSSVPAAPTLYSPTNGSGNISVTPEFQLASTDADSDNLMYKIQLCADSLCSTVLNTWDETSSQTGWSGQDSDGGTDYASDPSSAANSTLAYFDYPSSLSQLTPNVTYYWRAYAIDPGGTDTWSPASSIQSFTTNIVETRILNGNIMSGTIL